VTVTRPWGTIADGMTPPFVGALAVEVAKEAVDDVLGVSEGEIVEAMKLLMTRAKLYVEGAGAAATAAILAGKARVAAGAKVVALISGGNVDLSRIPRDESAVSTP
jgi:threonine dehydratase